MGAPELHADNVSGHLTPYMYAEMRGISIVVHGGLPSTVASNGDTVICSPHCDERVAIARAWEGIAQCLLTRAGRRWSAREAKQLGLRLQRQHEGIH